MKYRLGLIIPLYIIITCISYSYAQSDIQNLNLQKLCTYIEQNIENWNIPGLAIAIVKNNKKDFIKGFGVLDVNKKDKVNKAFLLYSAVTALWICIDYLLYTQIEPDVKHMLFRFSNSLKLATSFLFLNFIFVFFKKKNALNLRIYEKNCKILIGFCDGISCAKAKS